MSEQAVWFVAIVGLVVVLLYHRALGVTLLLGIYIALFAGFIWALWLGAGYLAGVT